MDRRSVLRSQLGLLALWTAGMALPGPGPTNIAVQLPPVQPSDSGIRGSGNFGGPAGQWVNVPAGAALVVRFASGYAGVTTISGVYDDGKTFSNATTGVVGGRPMIFRNPLLGPGFLAVKASASDANILWDIVPDGAYPPFDSGAATVIAGTNPDVVVVPPGTGTLGVALTLYTTKNVILQLEKGTYTEDQTLWPASSSALVVRGPALPPFQTGGNITPGGAIINFTALPASANANVAFDVVWQWVSFTGPTLIAASTAAPTIALFNGSGNYALHFYECLWYDLSAPTTLNDGGEIRCMGSFFKQSASVPTRMEMGFLASTGAGYWIGNNVNYSVQKYSTGPTVNGSLGVWVGFAGYGGSPGGPWYITDNRILDDNLSGYWSDSMLDFETKAPLSGLYMERNAYFNSKLFLASVGHAVVRDNIFRHTINQGMPGNTGIFHIISKTPGANPTDAGTHIIEGNTFIHDVIGGSTYVPCVSLSMRYDISIQSLRILGNRFIVDGSPTGTFAGNTIAVIQVKSNTAGKLIDNVEISDNEFGFSAVGGTTRPLISFRNDTGGTVNRVTIRGNRGLGTNANSAGGDPATVAAGGSFFVSVAVAAGTFAVGTFEMRNNDLTDAALTGASPKLINNLGTFTWTKLRLSGNSPREATDTVTVGASEFTYTHGTSALVTLGLPAQGPSWVDSSAGTVSQIKYNGVVVAAVTGYGVLMDIGDTLAITYTVAPTLRVIPMTSGAL